MVRLAPTGNGKRVETSGGSRCTSGRDCRSYLAEAVTVRRGRWAGVPSDSERSVVLEGGAVSRYRRVSIEMAEQ